MYRTETLFATAKRSLQPQRTLTPFEQYRANPTPRLKAKLVEANWGLVQKAARRIAHQCDVDFQDLCQEGSFGLLRAIEEFDPATGNAFSSFAMPWIRGAIMHYLRDKGWGTLRVPRQAVEQYARVKGAHRRLTAAGRELSEVEVAQGLGITRQRWEFVKEIREAPTPASLDESPLEIESGVSEEEDLSWVYAHLVALPTVQRYCIVEHVFGRFELQEIAKRHGLTSVVVQGHITAGLTTMRQQIEEERHHANS